MAGVRLAQVWRQLGFYPVCLHPCLGPWVRLHSVVAGTGVGVGINHRAVHTPLQVSSRVFDHNVVVELLVAAEGSVVTGQALRCTTVELRLNVVGCSVGAEVVGHLLPLRSLLEQVGVGLLLQALVRGISSLTAQTWHCQGSRDQASDGRQRVVVGRLVLTHCLLHGVVCQVTGHVLSHSGGSGRTHTATSGQGVCATTSHNHHLHGTQTGHVGQRVNRTSDEASGQTLPRTGFFYHLVVGALLGEVELASLQVGRRRSIQQVLVLVGLVEAFNRLLPVHVDGCAEEGVRLVVLRVGVHTLHHVPDGV